MREQTDRFTTSKSESMLGAGRRRRAGGLVLGAAILALPVVAAVVAGFQGPLFGLATAPNGDVLVADASVGVISIRKHKVGDSISLPNITDVSPIGRRSMWAITGAGDAADRDTGQGLHRISRGSSRKVVNLFEFEMASNPDGNLPFDSNPFDVQAMGGDTALVVDAGANDLLWIDNQGHVSVLAVFPDELVSTDNIKNLAGCPDSMAFFCGLPPMIPAQAVPTSVAVDDDGNIYVGELKGFPAPTNESNIWRIAPGASWAMCGSSPDCTKVFDGGFTSIIDLAVGPDGDLLVAEMDEASWAAVEIFGTPTGGTVNACDVHAGTCNEIVTGIPELTAITVGKDDDTLWVTRNALVPGAAEVVKFDLDDDSDSDSD